MAINAIVEFRSTDDKKPGTVKRYAFRDVFYSMVYGSLSYQQLLDEVTAVQDTQQLGNSTNFGAGSGSMPSGSKSSGSNYDPSITFATLKQNGK